jgi:hypothetical protein
MKAPMFMRQAGGARWSLARCARALLLTLACGCAPSAFDELTSSRENSSAACDGSACLDASVLDASVDASIDAASPPPDAAGSDARVPDSSMPAPCNGAAYACEANQQEPQMEACGACNSGMRSRTRSCAPDRCSWGEWSEWSTCGGQTAACTPSATETRSVACTTCGSRNQKRTCSSSCTWGGWENDGRCSWCEQCARVVYCDTPNNVAANRGTWCVQEACSQEQALDDCKEDARRPDICNGITEPFYMEYQ